MTNGASRTGTLEGLFRSVLGLTAEDEVGTLTAEGCEAWDSMAHINLILAVEQAFAIRLSPEQASESTSFEAFSRLVDGEGAA